MRHLIYKKSTQLENEEELLFWSTIAYYLAYGINHQYELWTKSFPTTIQYSKSWVCEENISSNVGWISWLECQINNGNEKGWNPLVYVRTNKWGRGGTCVFVFGSIRRWRVIDWMILFVLLSLHWWVTKTLQSCRASAGIGEGFGIAQR